MKCVNITKMINKNIIAGALFDFMGYITSRNNTIHVGSKEFPGPLLDAFQDWCKTRNLTYDDPNIKDWDTKI